MAACCGYTGTCGACTHDGLDYVKTARNWTCCCHEPFLVPDTVRFLASTPEECSSVDVVSTGNYGIYVAAVVGLVLLLFFLALFAKQRGWFTRKIHDEQTQPILTDFHERESVYHIEMTTIL